MSDPPPDPGARRAATRLLSEHLATVAEEEWVRAVEHEPPDRWYVRFATPERDGATVHLVLDQRSVRYELYFLPDPPAGREDVHRLVLRANHDLDVARFSLGPDGDLYLRGRIPLEHLDAVELDHHLGVLYQAVERFFPLALALVRRGRRA